MSVLLALRIGLREYQKSQVFKFLVTLAKENPMHAINLNVNKIDSILWNINVFS